MRIDIITIFPGMFEGPLTESMIKRAADNGLLDIRIHYLRDYTHDRHKTVDDYPFGGGAGMLMKPAPVFTAVESIVGKSAPFDDEALSVILMCPQGRRFDQEVAKELSRKERLVLICGHYEGFDERIRERLANDEISIGDYVLTGGELPAMVVIDSVARMIPGVLKEEESAVCDSFYQGLLDYPQYTRPQKFRDWEVPDVIVSGDHEKIRRWRRKESLRRTLERRPNLLDKAMLTEEDKALLKEIDNDL